ncbi:unnamed protein product [Amoebophrya sp. A25]|nr:unnamed protein product [Amoebophrya sp. A25]|eukprot:GSA25T00023729001.1
MMATSSQGPLFPPSSGYAQGGLTTRSSPGPLLNSGKIIAAKMGAPNEAKSEKNNSTPGAAMTRGRGEDREALISKVAGDLNDLLTRVNAAGSNVENSTKESSPRTDSTTLPASKGPFYTSRTANGASDSTTGTSSLPAPTPQISGSHQIGGSAASNYYEHQKAPTTFSHASRAVRRPKSLVFRDDRSSVDSRQVVNRLLLSSLEAANQQGGNIKRKCGWFPPLTRELFPEGTQVNNSSTASSGLDHGSNYNTNAGENALNFSSNFESANLLQVFHITQPGDNLHDVAGGGPGGLGAPGAAGDHFGASGGGPKEGTNPNLPGTSAPSPPTTQHEYELWMRPDSQVPSERATCQWFLFACFRPHCQQRLRVRMRIMNFRKPKSCYQIGMQPYVYRIKRGKDTVDTVWTGSACKNVEYMPGDTGEGVGGGDGRRGGLLPGAEVKPPYINATTGTFSGDTFPALPKADNYILSFDFEFEPDEECVYFAAYPPYTYTMLLRFLREIDQLKSPNIAKKEIGRTLANIPTPLLIVTSPKVHGISKKDVVVIARQHPGEAVGSWACQGFVKFLIGNSSLANLLRTTHVFHIVPMVNVDGVVYGNNRCTLLGVDPNRCWVEPNAVLHPLVSKIKAYVASLNSPVATSGTASGGGGAGTSGASGAPVFGIQNLQSMQTELTQNLSQRPGTDWVPTEQTGTGAGSAVGIQAGGIFSDRDLDLLKSGKTGSASQQSSSVAGQSRPSTECGTRGRSVVLFLDIHGHSARTHAFLYGCLPSNLRVTHQSSSAQLPHGLLQQAFLEEDEEDYREDATVTSTNSKVIEGTAEGQNGRVADGDQGVSSGGPSSQISSSASATSSAITGAGNNKSSLPAKLLRLCAQHAVFPKLTSLASSDFAMTHCNWQVSRAHKRAARYVMYKQLDIFHSFTVEISLFGICSHGSRKPEGQRSIQLFTPRRAEWIGVALGRSLVPQLSGNSGMEMEIATTPSSLPFLTFDKLQGENLVEKVIRSFERSIQDSFHRDNGISLVGHKNSIDGHSDSENSDDDKKKKKADKDTLNGDGQSRLEDGARKKRAASSTASSSTTAKKKTLQPRPGRRKKTVGTTSTSNK